MANENKLSVQNATPQIDNISLDGGIFTSAQVFNTAQRMANALATSTIVPKDYQGNVGNCLIALEMAARLRTSPMMVMQNLYIVNGRPAWSSLYITAVINNSHKYKTELQFDMSGSGSSLSCYAWVEDFTGHKVVGPTITMQMATEEGWLARNGSKWKTMPEVMIRYRAASFFGRLNCPEMIMGIYTADEVVEIPAETVQDAIDRSEYEIAQNANTTPIDTTPTQADPPSPPENKPAPSDERAKATYSQRTTASGQTGMNF